jgi:hypothetical protein
MKSNKQKSKTSETMRNVVIEATDHALIQLYDRFNFNSYAHIIDSDVAILYPDISKSNVHYLNIIPTGFVVLRRTEDKKFVIITVTLDEHRNFGEPIKLVSPKLRERQGEDVPR